MKKILFIASTILILLSGCENFHDSELLTEKTPWLSTHVSLIMMSYALFAFMMLNGILALCLRRSARMLML